MNAITTTQAEALPLPNDQLPRLYPVDNLRPGALQPRKRFDQAALQDLAESIKALGVAQHIIIRQVEISPFDYGLEIVAGERRWRAAKLAGLTHIPAILRTLTDIEALELAIIENDQRKDLHPIEQAEGYEALLKQYGHTETTDKTAEALAQRIGKSRTYVYNRLKLLQLVPDARDAFFEGKLPTTLAEKVARLPMHQQPLALKAIMKDGECLPVRDAQAVLRRDFMLRLNIAPFPINSATLLPHAGSCKTCHKRTGHEPDLFADVEHNDTCTDPPCYRGKVAANNLLIKAKAERQGIEVIHAANAHALLKFGTTSDALNGDYVYMDQPLANLTGTDKPLKKLLGKALKPSALFEHPKDNTLREIVQVTKATDALRDAGLLLHDPEAGRAAKKAGQRALLDTSVAAPRDKPEPAINTKVIQLHSGDAGSDEAAPDDAANDGQADGDSLVTCADLQREWAWREKAFTAIHNTLHDFGQVPTGLFSLMLVRRLGMTVPQQSWALLARLWGWDETADIYADPSPLWLAAQDLNGDQLEMLIAELLVLGDVHPQAWALNTIAADTAESDLVKALDDPDLDVGLDWCELSKAPYPTQSPPPAGDDKGAPADEEAGKPAQEVTIQAPQGAQSDEGAQKDVPAHWVGQHVKVKGAKRFGEISEISPNGDLLVAFPSGEKGVRNLHSFRSHELEVLPNQTPPAKKLTPVDAWQFPKRPD